MSTLKNMKGEALRNLKFRIADESQSERLQNVLFSLGYRWAGGDVVQLTDKEFIYTDRQNRITWTDECDKGYFLRHQNEEQDAEAFIAAHPVVQESFKGLEDAYDTPSENLFAIHPDKVMTGSEKMTAPWLDNTGECPVEDGNTRVDVELVSGGQCTDWPAEHFSWRLEGYGTDILKWRYHRADDWFKAPKTDKLRVKSLSSLGDKEPGHISTGTIDTSKGFFTAGNLTITSDGKGWHRTVEASEAANKILLAEHEEAAEELRQIDSHYDFTYQLTSEDEIAGSLKIDPYFVSQQWQLGSKDSTGVIFHLLKTLARFGDKNSKEREITALYKSVVRLAQLEGVVL